MNQLLLIILFLLYSFTATARKILVKNNEELKTAIDKAIPGDTILLQNGEWNNVLIKAGCLGTEQQPIVISAQTQGKVVISGRSQLRLGGNYIVVSGLYFKNGCGPGSAVIDFRISDKAIANHCRVTNCVIDDFNKPGRLDEDYWVSFSGRYNRIDHCSFINKKNLGVLMAVVLDDDRSRENHHSIDHNYFGLRMPLASNGGEIIRVGVSQHCQFNSFTRITDNLFEHCDGEAEVISIKSGGNQISGNVFKECQGSVVLRHGDNNTVANNIFLGNNKEGTGGVRIINHGQWVVNNLFYRLRGSGFRSPMAIMNGIPNSPANRYVQVTDAVIMNNSFVESTPISLGEGSDSERSLPPARVFFAGNIFYNTKDSIIYRAFDDIGGFRFSENQLSPGISQQTAGGFLHAVLRLNRTEDIGLPEGELHHDRHVIDSLDYIATRRGIPALPEKTGFHDGKLYQAIMKNVKENMGAPWLIIKKEGPQQTTQTITCSSAAAVYRALGNQQTQQIILLTGGHYNFPDPLVITGRVTFKSKGQGLHFTSGNIQSLFRITGKGMLDINGLDINGSGVRAANFISNDTAGSSEHYGLGIRHSRFRSFSAGKGCRNLVFAYKSSVADSIVIRDNSFINNQTNAFVFNDEKDDKGYYSVEKLTINNNRFLTSTGILLQLYRGGTDESTMGPELQFEKNIISDCQAGQEALLVLTGAQKTRISGNVFQHAGTPAPLLVYKDLVRARHLLLNNRFLQCGTIQKNEFVHETNNTTR